jgi:hypothetical protein
LKEQAHELIFSTMAERSVFSLNYVSVTLGLGSSPFLFVKLGLENIIQALDAYPSPYNPEAGHESPEEFWAATNLVDLNVFVYWEMGDFSSADRAEAEWEPIRREYLKNNWQNNMTLRLQKES